MRSIRYFSRILVKLEFSQQIFEESPNIKFHQNPSIGSRDVPCVRKKEIVTFRNFLHAPNKCI
jgi:hypothetical protein